MSPAHDANLQKHPAAQRHNKASRRAAEVPAAAVLPPRQVGVARGPRILAAFSFWLLAAALASGQTPLPEATTLELDVQLGEPLRFTIGPPRAAGASWLRLRVEQLGSDVSLTLRGSGGVERLADQPLGYHQPELLLLPAGTYELLIDVRVPGAARVEWRGLGAEDRRFAGDLAWSAATDQFRRDSEASLAASMERFLEAAEAYGAAELPADQARALLAAGHVAADVGETEVGLARLRRALELYEQAGDVYGAADAWQQIGHVHRLRGELDEAREALETALEISTASGDRRGQARALLNLGFVDQRASRADEARAAYGRARALLDGAPDPGLEAKLLNNLAGLDFESGRLRGAVASFEALLDFDVGVADPRARARTLINLAAARRLLGRYQGALDAYDEALEALAGVGEPRLEATILNNLGFTYLRLGELARAGERLEEALSRRRRAGDRRSVATTLNNLGRVAMAEGSWAAAAGRFGEALEIRRQLDDARGQAHSLHDLGRLELARGRLRQAQDSLEWAMLARRELGDQLGEASSAAELAEVHAAAGRPAEALELASRAIRTCRRLGSRGDEARALLTQLRSLRRLGRAEQALEGSGRALELAESLRFELESPDLRATLLAAVRGLYEEVVDLQVERGDWRGAFAVAERARARAFLDVLHEPGEARLPPAVRQQHRQKLEDLAGLRYAMQRFRRRGQAPPEPLEAAWRQLSLEVDRLEHASQRQGAAELAGAPTIELADFQELLDAETRALVFLLAEQRSFLWVIERERASIRILPPRRQLASLSETAIEHFRVFDPRAGEAMKRAAAAAAEALLDGALDGAPGRLVLIPEGPLLRLPFAALPVAELTVAELPGKDPDSLLVDRFEIVHLPSASALPALRRLAERPPPGGGLVLIADPAYERRGEAPPGEASPGEASPGETSPGETSPGEASRRETPTRLDGSRREAERLAALDGVRAHSLLGARARREAVLGDALASFGYVHFATHATVDPSRPELSALVLSLADAEGRAIDGHVRLADVYGMSLDAELVVLSGCDTGLGREVRGEGLLGLTRGFFFAGAARVASSLWRVEDAATAELMSRFYRYLLVDRETPGAALRRAQLSLRAERRHQHPFFWAAFTLQGDWRPPADPAPGAPR